MWLGSSGKVVPTLFTIFQISNRILSIQLMYVTMINEFNLFQGVSQILVQVTISQYFPLTQI